ncbi:hypothetical protein [Cellulomonas fengjieae]|uniref:N-acetyltransferase domain-containing protein n=1 Tax=Cellulomonas fengjieae TaxID=2819978 RepID=A0ABS3SLG9_9CELL|nr:hypothetical protein [Cellulomonas fengjieae]MBO3086588.1 hypothetical protein [Cellulomonas fengjieae]QVI66559.1 hypothetical protein KG102_02845 [Cellulomonas fengjieae]
MAGAAALVQNTVPATASIGVRAANNRLARLYQHQYGFQVGNADRPLELLRPAQ